MQGRLRWGVHVRRCGGVVSRRDPPAPRKTIANANETADSPEREKRGRNKTDLCRAEQHDAELPAAELLAER